jgi:hypothetical protein
MLVNKYGSQQREVNNGSKPTMNSTNKPKTDPLWEPPKSLWAPYLMEGVLTGPTGPTDSLSAKEIYNNIMALNDEMLKQGLPPHVHPLVGIRLFKSPWATRPTNKPKVVYQPNWLTRWFPKRYKQRKQTLLNKAFGFIQEPCVFVVNPEHVHTHPSFNAPTWRAAPAPYIVAHPHLYQEIKQLLDSQKFDEALDEIHKRNTFSRP